MIELIAIFLGAGAFMAVAEWAAAAPRLRRYRIEAADARKAAPTAGERRLRAAVNGTVAVGLFAAALHWGSPWLVTAPSPPVWVIPGEVLAVLLLYDFLYYFMHRLLHVPALMRAMHGVHHRARNPTAMDGLFESPIEIVAGIVLLLASIALLGPVSYAAFLSIIVAHTVINIIAHTNLAWPSPVFAPWNSWSVRHHIHAVDMERNFSLLFPFWDVLFRTYRFRTPT